MKTRVPSSEARAFCIFASPIEGGKHYKGLSVFAQMMRSHNRSRALITRGLFEDPTGTEFMNGYLVARALPANI